jgi:hypothetical protein
MYGSVLQMDMRVEVFDLEKRVRLGGMWCHRDVTVSLLQS